MQKPFFYLFAFFLFSSTVQHAQSLTSVIVDSVSKKPIPYATVQLNNKGMITNEEGRFKFLLKDDIKATDSLFISCIGYESMGKPISEFTDSLIYLKPKAIELREVIVSNKNYTPREIIELVEENIQKNYITQFSKKRLFLRETYQNNIIKTQYEIKKSSIEAFNKNFLDSVIQTIPKNNIYYTEMLGDLYGADDADEQKLDLIKASELYDKSKELDVELLEEKFNKIVKEIQDSAMQKTRLGIPVLYGIDNIHGANYVNGSVMFPHQIAVAATWNTELSRIGAEITSYESRAASLPWNFNPNADVATNPLWGRIGESFGEDPYLISEMTKAYIKGSQEKGLQNSTSSAVCIKHFVGYGAGKNGKDRANAIIPENSLRQYFLPPFEKALKNGAMGVMISSNAVNGIPCHLNNYYITDILKGEMGFKGVVISDFSDVEFLVAAHQSAKDMREATKLAVNSGIDLLMNPYDADVVDLIVELVEKGEISKERIDDAVTRVLRLKFYLNLFETPYNNPKEYPDFGSEKHIDANYKTASEAITLLKNENAVLPLSSNKKVLVTGYSANSINMLNGAWSRSFLGRDTTYNDSSKLTILDAIKKQVGAKNVDFVEGTDYLEDINSDLAVSKAKKADYIVVCVGEIPASEKPSDINELELPKVQQELVKKLAKTGKPII